MLQEDSTSNSSRRYPTAISLTSYWRCSPTAASPSAPVMVNTSGYGDSGTAYLKARCWLPCSSTSTCMTCHLRSPRSTDTQTILPSYFLTTLGDDRRGPYCGHVNLVHLPEELVPKAQHHEDHVLLIPSQQPIGKVRAQSSGGWQPIVVQGNTDVPWSEAQPDPDLPTTPGEDVSKNNIPRLSDTPPRRNHHNEDPSHLHPGSGLLHRCVLCTGLVQNPTHIETGCGTEQLLAHCLWISVRHSCQPPTDPLWHRSGCAMPRSSSPGTRSQG